MKFKTFEQKTGAPPTNEKETSILTKAYDTILASLNKVLDAFKNLKLPKGEDTKVKDLDDKSRRNIKQVLQDFKSSLPLVSQKDTFKPQVVEEKYSNKFNTGAGTFKKSEPSLSDDNSTPSKTEKPTGLLERQNSAESSKRRSSNTPHKEGDPETVLNITRVQGQNANKER